MSKLDEILRLMVRDHINFGADAESDEMFEEDKAAAKQAIKALGLNGINTIAMPKEVKKRLREFLEAL